MNMPMQCTQCRAKDKLGANIYAACFISVVYDRQAEQGQKRPYFCTQRKRASETEGERERERERKGWGMTGVKNKERQKA